ncbi:MAG TPA: glycosyltransferase family 2 protein [Nitrososphaeraceae archaeon]|nr:glycosyltransferase family 2 protein [Nitrososphaeraceae archaeon]
MTTVSIGIPSYNEESNITTILESVICSNLNSIDLSEIIISDDSTDDTPNIVKQFIKNHSKKIIFVHNRKRRGAANAWNDIIQNATGQIIVLYDADVKPNPNCTLELVNKINNNVGICASNPRPIRGQGIPAQGTIFVCDWLESVRKRQISEYTVMGRGLSIRSDIAKKITIPKSVIAIDLYIQSKVMEMGYDVVFNPNAIVQFKPAKTFVDFSSQVIRASKGHGQLKKLGYGLKNQLTLKTAMVEYIRVALRNPNGALSTCLCYFMIPFYMSRIKNIDSALWHTAQSTK